MPAATSMTELARAQSLREVLATPILAGARVLAGEEGLARTVERLNVMEVPDILPWVKPAEFLLTTGYPLREHPDDLTGLVADLDDAGLAGLGIKLGRYLDEVPPAMLALADERGFAVVRLPDDVSFDEVFNEVLTGMLNQQAERLARSERIHHTFLQLVLRGHGLAEIVAELAELVDGPAAIVGRAGQLLAGTRLAEIEGLDDDAVTHVDVDPEAGTARLGGRTVRCRAAPIAAGTRLHGQAVVLAGRTALPDDRLAVENAATTAALAMAKDMELAALEAKYQSDLVHDVLTGRVADPANVHERARAFGWDLDRPLVVLVLEVDEPAEAAVGDGTAGEASPPLRHRPPLVSAVRGRVGERDSHAAVVRFSDEVVILTRAFTPVGDDDGTAGRRAARDFAARLAEDGAATVGTPVSAGVSRPVPALAAVPDAYEQATTAVSIGRRVQGAGGVAHFDGLGIHRVLSLIEDDAELRAFARETLGTLAGDDEEAVDLRHTLRVLLEANCNVAEAARRLHFHYNTLRYRIEKLEGIVGPFVDDARARLDVHVALLILRMRGLDGD